MNVLAISHIFSNFIRKIMGLFEEYKNHPDKTVRERANNWGAAIGLQNVDGLSVSEFLIQLARQQIVRSFSNILIRMILIFLK